MFRATMCPSSGELTVSMRHWYLSLCMGGCLACCSRPDQISLIIRHVKYILTSKSVPNIKQQYSTLGFNICVFELLFTQTHVVRADQTATHTECKIPVSHRYSKFSWWWAHSCPKHVQKLK